MSGGDAAAPAKRVNLAALAIALPFVGVVTFLLHEGGHWVAGEWLGHDMALSLNRAVPLDSPTQTHLLIITAAGIAVTLIEGLIGLLLVRVNAAIGYAIAFFAFFMRLMAFGITVAVNPNDEARIGTVLGVGPYVPHIVVVLALLGVVVLAARRARAGWMANILAWVVCSITVTAIVYLDRVIGQLA